MAKPKDQVPLASFEQWLARLKEAGFTVQAQDRGRVRISKHGCATVLEPSPSGEPKFAVRPGLLVRAAPALPVLSAVEGSGVEGTVSERSSLPETNETIAHLLDRGFQKFWQEGERQIPALSAQLHALHRFDQDLRAVMGLTALYNEALVLQR